MSGAAAPTRRRRGRGVAALVVAALAVSPAVAGRPQAAADTTPAPQPTETLPVTVTLGRLTPYAPQPGGTLHIRGTLRNTSSSPVTDLAVSLVLSHTKVGFRSAFQEYAATPDGPPPTDGLPVTAATVDVPRTELAGGAVERYSIDVPVDALALPEAWQVYELAVLATGQPSAVPVGAPTVVGRLRTFLPYAPVDATGVGEPTDVAWIWPLVDRPHRVTETTWRDDALAGELPDSGRLGSLVAAAAAAATQHRAAPPPRKHLSKRAKRRLREAPPPPPKPPLQPVPVTWAIDPMLLEDATLMSRGYDVTVDGRTTPGTGQAAAEAWLRALTAATATGQVLALPYADPDVTAAVRSRLTREVQVAGSPAYQSVVARVTGRTPLGYAWPPDGLLDQRALNALSVSGVTTVVLDSAALPYADGAPSETPAARTTVKSRDDPNLDALLADHGLANDVAEGTTEPADGPLAVQQLLSELLMIQSERPFDRRTFVIAPDRRWAPRPDYARALLSGTGQVPWIHPVTLDEVATAEPSLDVLREPLTFPPAERQLQLRRAYLDGVIGIRRGVDALAAILPPGDAQARALDAAILRLLSSAWRADPAGATVQRDALAAHVARTMHAVRIASKDNSQVTLTSHSGTVPVTIRNDLDTPVHIVVGIDDTPRLAVRTNRVSRVVPAHRQVPIDIRATAQTSGEFALRVQLYTPTGQRYGAPVELRIRSTAYGTTALVITGGAAAALLVAVAVRLVRRARGARAAR